MASRIVVMKGGYIQQIGTPIEIYDHPSNLFVATFIGSPAMNVLEGEYEDGEYESSEYDENAEYSEESEVIENSETEE